MAYSVILFSKNTLRDSSLKKSGEYDYHDPFVFWKDGTIILLFTLKVPRCGCRTGELALPDEQT